MKKRENTENLCLIIRGSQDHALQGPQTVSMEFFPLGPFHVKDYSANFVVNVARRIIRLMVSVSDRVRYDDKDSINDIYEKQNFDADSFPSCYDDSAIREQLDDHEQRLSELETLCDMMNADLSTLKTIVEAVKANDYVESVDAYKEAPYWSDYADMIYPFEYN